MSLAFLPMAGWIQISVLVLLLILLAPPIGSYMARILQGQRCFMTPFFSNVENTIYRLCRINPKEEMDVREYTKALLAFTIISFLGLFILLIAQIFPEVSFPLAFEATASFLTGTNWQSSIPEITFTNNSQQFGFVVQNFLSCSVGIAVMAALARGVRRTETDGMLGNFWADMTRCTLYLLLPLSTLMAIFLVSQGVIQSFEQTIAFRTLETAQDHFLAVGPVASQAAIKQLGTNGGGFFMANAAHPFANPTPLSNFIQILALLILPASSVFAFGKMVGATKQSWMLLSTMLLVIIPAALAIIAIEHAGNPFLSSLSLHNDLGNMEGKEFRFTAASAGLFTAAAGATSGGSLNAALDSFMPSASFIPLMLMQFGENIFGGAGTGLTNMIVYVFFAIFTASLMIGRRPQYLGKKIGVAEMQMVALVIIIPAFLTLLGTAAAVLTELGQAGSAHDGPHGFSEILYAFTSAANNNGSSLGGIDPSSNFYHITLSLAMLLGRFGALCATLKLASCMALQSKQNTTEGMLKIDTPFFVFFLIMIIVIGMLAYLPSLAIGPLAEHITLGGSL